MTAILAVLLLRLRSGVSQQPILIVLSSAFIAGAINIQVFSHSYSGKAKAWTAWYWPLVFAGGVISNALHFVLQSYFMLTYTRPDIETLRLVSGSNLSPPPQGFLRRESVFSKDVSDGNTVKISMLCIDTLFQVLWTLLLAPLDVLFKESASLSDALRNAADGLNCIFTCTTDILFFTSIFVAGFAVSHGCAAFLNHHSPVICSIVILAASPLTVITVLVVPRWDAHHTPVPLYAAALAAFMTVVGAAIFAEWERRVRKPITDSRSGEGDYGSVS